MESTSASLTPTPPLPPRRRSSFGSSASMAQQLLSQATQDGAHVQDASRSSLNTVITHSSKLSANNDAHIQQEQVHVDNKPLPPLPEPAARTTVPKPATAIVPPPAPAPAPRAPSAPTASSSSGSEMTPLQRFQALDDAAFASEFGMPRGAFNAMPTWKQQRMRKEHKLF